MSIRNVCSFKEDIKKSGSSLKIGPAAQDATEDQGSLSLSTSS